MPNRLFERLSNDYRTLTESYEEILNRCADEGRDPSDTEAGTLEGLRSEMEPLGERLVELRATDERRFRTIEAMAGAPELPELHSGTAPVVHVRSDPEVYRPDAHPDERYGFFADLFSAQMVNDLEARSRLDRHNLMMRAATTITGAGAVPPNWLTDEFAALAHGSRPWADTLRRLPIDNATPVTIGVQTVPGAVVVNQATENVFPPTGEGEFTAVPLVTTPQTKTGRVDVSRQLLDGSNPAVDGLVYADVMGAYAENIESMVVAAFTALVNANIAGNFPVNIAGDPGAEPPVPPDQIPDGVIDAGTAVRTQRKSAPNVFFCSEIVWGELTKQKDAMLRPLIVTGYHGPSNARGLGEALVYGHVSGEVAGMQAIPSWAGNNTQAYVLKADDSLLLESSSFMFRYEEVLGPQTIRLGVWGYAAVVLGRYPKGIARITLSGGPADVATGTGNGGGEADEAKASRGK